MTRSSPRNSVLHPSLQINVSSVSWRLARRRRLDISQLRPHDSQAVAGPFGPGNRLVWESSAPHWSHFQSSERGPVSPRLKRRPHGTQRVSGPLGPMYRRPVVSGHQSQHQFFAGGPVAPYLRRPWHDTQSPLHRLDVCESSAPHQSQVQSSDRGPVSPFLQRALHLEQSVFRPRGPACLGFNRWHQAHFREVHLGRRPPGAGAGAGASPSSTGIRRRASCRNGSRAAGAARALHAEEFEGTASSSSPSFFGNGEFSSKLNCDPPPDSAVS